MGGGWHQRCFTSHNDATTFTTPLPYYARRVKHQSNGICHWLQTKHCPTSAALLTGCLWTAQGPNAASPSRVAAKLPQLQESGDGFLLCDSGQERLLRNAHGLGRLHPQLRRQLAVVRTLHCRDWAGLSEEPPCPCPKPPFT